MQPESITRRFATLAVLLVTALTAGPSANADGQASAASPGRVATRPATAADAPFVDAPEYLALFVPRRERASYRTAVSPHGLEAVLTSLADDESLLRPPGAWQPRAEPAQDAFGMGGDYNGWTLARLYGGTQPRVARGPKTADGRVTEAWILVSPYPDASLTRLLPGTLRIAVALPPG